MCEEWSNDLEMCRSMLDGCEVILPLGMLTEVYDARGFRYNLPAFCICNPQNVNASVVTKKSAPLSAAEDGEKRGSVRIRLCTGEDLSLSLEPNATVSELKREVARHTSLAPTQKMLVIWRGRLLQDGQALKELQLPARAVIQVMFADEKPRR